MQIGVRDKRSRRASRDMWDIGRKSALEKNVPIVIPLYAVDSGFCPCSMPLLQLLAAQSLIMALPRQYRIRNA